jgi:hypothetical protein
MNSSEPKVRMVGGWRRARLLFLALGLTTSSVFGGSVIYVNQAATGVGDGSTWTDAYAGLQPALDAAGVSEGAIGEIWVAKGTYKPSKRTDPNDPRSATFQLIDGVPLFGGFAGTEASSDERNIDANPTVLSGDLNGDDGPNFVNYGENTYHVVTGIGVGNATVFDGLTITGGHAPGPGFPGSYGGGMHLVNAHPEIRNCTFTRNLAERPHANVAWSGGGGAALFMYQEEQDPSPPPLNVSRSRFTDNNSIGDGGAVLIWGAYFAGSTVVTECSFERNVGVGAFSGFWGNDYTFRSCVFADNSSRGPGGAIWAYSDGDILMEACRFERNTAGWGGAAVVQGGQRVVIRDSIFADNAAGSGSSGALQVYGAYAVEFTDDEFRGNSAYSAGGVYVDAQSTIAERCQFINNVASRGYAGGLELVGGASDKVTECSFVNNGTPDRGGGMSSGGNAILKDCVFSDNYGGRLGGGLYASGNTLLVGCTFTNNSADEGGGVHDYSSRLTVVDTAFEQNYATIGGGVFAGSYFDARLERCRFSHNSAYTGGGVAALGAADFLFDRCEFTDNYATVGGGLSTLDPIGSADLRSCLFAGNTGLAYGGGIAGGGGPLRVKNSTIAHNTAGGLGAGLIVGNDTTISNSVVWGNVVDPGGEAATDEVAQIEGIGSATIGYSNVQGWSGANGGEGNIGLDPLFVQPVDPDGPLEPGEPDFRVRPESPCINAGLTETPDPGPWDPPPPNLDLDGKPRVLCKAVDMGAYEFGVTGDVDCNLRVDLIDFSLWPQCAFGPGAPGLCPAFDADGDGDIDLRDAAALFRAFSPTPP